MSTVELLKKVRKIEIKTRGLTNQVFAGSYHSAFRGRGMSFSEVREYQYGDDIRNIDWNVTARYNQPFVKIYEEERELTVMLLVDVSRSGDFGSHHLIKKDIITELSAVLSFSAIKNNDKVGLILFSDKIETFIPPKKGKSHILRIIRALVEPDFEHKATDIASALKQFQNMMKKRTIAFLMSDFISPDFSDALKIVSQKHDLIALRVYDKNESEMPQVGLLKVQDLESGTEQWIDTSVKAVRKRFTENCEKRLQKQRQIFAKAGIDLLEINTTDNYIQKLMALFKQRGLRR